MGWQFKSDVFFEP